VQLLQDQMAASTNIIHSSLEAERSAHVETKCERDNLTCRGVVLAAKKSVSKAGLREQLIILCISDEDGT
jgi:hypothetical protein